jgi:hypothetical protein
MDKFNKITVGFVVQTFEKNKSGKFVCTKQEYEDIEGNPIEPPDHRYQPYNMTL